MAFPLPSTKIIFIILTIIICFTSSTFSQQPYIREDNTDCDSRPKESSALGFFCNGLNTSCQAYLTFRSRPPYNTVVAISDLLAADPSEISEINSVSKNSTFEANNLVFVPVNCSCSGEFYQTNASYIAKADDNYFDLANNTFQGLTTCQALANQTGNPPILEIETGQTIRVPLRCACPTKNQTDVGVNYLMSYLTDYDDDDYKISVEFGVDNQLLLKANRLSDLDNTIYPDTTILVPLKTPPSNSQSIEPLPSPLLPPTSSPPSSSSNTSSKKNTWLYALFGSIGGLFLLVLGTVIFFTVFRRSKKKSDSVLVSETSNAGGKIQKETREFLDSISDATQSLKLYGFEELMRATDGFSSACLIEGSVYRGVVDGILAAIKRVDGDVSKEINLQQKINHFNLISLSGVCLNKDHWYLVYEYASNGPLSDWIFSDGKFLNWTQRIQIAFDVATGLNYLHSFTNPSHVHKDIKSSNILLDSDFRAKITNFGLARATQAQEGQFSLTNHIVGTIGYLAPEYLQNGIVSTKLDVYAFGVLLMEMLTGKEVSVLHEENRNSIPDALSAVLDGEGQEGLRQFMDPAMQGKYPAEFATFVVRIIDSCLKKNPETRPPMDEIAQFLSRILSNSLTWELSNNIAG
ncbi:hypothetical protein TIFTF001_002532 [Ficus carica]|uniref:Uncharacterized protein n=1 Tax=Ficus carica TaxID=3494 RepID=A0AA88CTL8_FICCA|nr:hypothetical protein TIFTF001_002532 [Ficus carica]